MGTVQRQDGARTYYTAAATNGKHMTYLSVFGDYEFLTDVLGYPNKVMVLVEATDPADEEYPAFRNQTFYALFRLNLDGSLDKTFNGTGRVVLQFVFDVDGHLSIDGIYEDGDVYLYTKDGQEVARINGVFASTPEELEWARAVIAAMEHAQGGVASMNGKMLDAPHLRLAKRMLSR